MKNESKAREFWIAVVDNEITDWVTLCKPEDGGTYIHVIEHSAYEALEARCAKLKAALMDIALTRSIMPDFDYEKCARAALAEDEE